MAKFLVTKIASAAAFLSTSLLLSGCATQIAKPEVCKNNSERCLKVAQKKNPKYVAARQGPAKKRTSSQY